jgi:hypothetical protein
MKRLKLLALAGATLLALSACTTNKNEAAKDPVTAVTDLAASVRANDFDRLTHIMVPPDDYAKLEAKYKADAAKHPAPTDEESKQFADQVAKFTAPDAEDKLFADIQPKLAQMGPQIPMGVAMMSGMAGQSIAQNPKMSEAEKTQANAVLTAITKWATTAPLADPDKAKQAIKVVVGTARDLKLTTLEAAQKMSFQDAMQKVGIAVGGLRKTLAVYNFDTDKMLDSVKATKKSEDGDNAVVTVTYTLLDTPVTADVKMVKVDGRWYSADLKKSIEDSLAKKADDATPNPPAGEPAMPPADMPASAADAGSDQNSDMAAPASGDQAADDQASEPADAASASSDASNGGG